MYAYIHTQHYLFNPPTKQNTYISIYNIDPQLSDVVTIDLSSENRSLQGLSPRLKCMVELF